MGNCAVKCPDAWVKVKVQGSSEEISVYHEKQRASHCAIHTLNNLFQEKWMTRSNMDSLADEAFREHKALLRRSGMKTPLISPFKSIIPFFGNYDIGVIVKALKIRNANFQKHIFRPLGEESSASSTSAEIEDIDYSSKDLVGFIINCERSQVPIISSKHWYAVARLNGVFYNMNSYLTEPEEIGNESKTKAFLNKEVIDNGSHLFTVTVACLDGKEIKHQLAEISI
mmetsp:Transcript_8017/g.10444  ORF Transcript_8017/g.10444 Transcript_8017/m.10444 type:complete len:227 (-) Transcript_8017:59-739(-)